jgi:DNA-binding NarL/FixJ family response regulator
MPESISVVIVDDHVLFRSGLRSLLQQEGIRVLGEASNAQVGIDLVQRLLPDVTIMDLHMPGMSGIDATRRLAAVAPHTRVLILTVSGAESDLTDAIMAGACGYLLKEASVSEIVLAVRAAAAGDAMVSPSLATGLLERLRHHESFRQHEPGVDLSSREQEVLRLVADGADNASIARELSISPHTVKNHISNILLKLHVDNRIQAAVRAVRDSLL